MEPTTDISDSLTPAKIKRFPAFLRIFEPAPAIPVTVTDPSEIRSQYRFWQKRILISTILGYAMFYFVRKNLSVAMPAMGKDLGIEKDDLGLFLTLHGVLYGISKFANGFLGDRCNGRVFMVAGLVLSAVMNIFFGFSSAVVTLGIVWMINGWVQGMGFPPCARLMTHWFSPKEFATKFAIWNTSHSIGAGLIVVLCGYLVAPHGQMIPGNWRLCFFIPAAIAIFVAVVLSFTLRDTPPSLGLPEVEGTSAKKKESAVKGSSYLMTHVFKNRYIWFISVANFFVYTIRYAVLDWGPTLLSETKGFKLNHAGWMVFAFEISGVVGMLFAGWLTDKVFGGRGSRTALFFMMLAGVFVFLFWKLPNQTPLLSTALLCCAGFCIYGPQALIGIVAANLGTKHAAATAVGLTGVFGYASTILSGWGLGLLVKKHGWDMGFAGMLICAAAGAMMFALAWPAKAHGYAEQD